MMRVMSLALRELGPGPLLRMGIYRAAVRCGWYRWRTPKQTWEQRPFPSWLRPGVPEEPAAYLRWRADHAPQTYFPTQEAGILQTSSDPASQAAVRLEQGRFTLFGELLVDLGNPPAWNLLPALEPGQPGQLVDMDRHWSEYQLERLPGDVKLLWEPARFGWAFDLVKAYRQSGDASHAETFWNLFEAWRVGNPPNSGLHWHSAQEVAYRTIALSFAVGGFHPYWLEHPAQVQRLIEAIAAGAARIPATMIYARAQDNNHLLLEAASLVSTGLLFPELRQAARWARVGRRALAAALERQVFDDGGYVQHSSNYHRLALQAGLWAGIIARRCGSPLPEASLERLRQMVDWLAAWIEPDTGLMPNLGPNDGAQLLPLTDLPLADFRPTLQAGALFLNGRRALPAGAWDDLAFWLGLPPDEQADVQPVQRTSLTLDFPQSGLYRVGGGKTFGMLRAVRFRNRPGHSDQMHFDLWWEGMNLACDAGTYLYNAPPPWENIFAGAWCHNTLTVDGYEPMLAAGRFLWLDWSSAELVCRWASPDGRVEWLEAQRSNFRPYGIAHRRSILSCAGLYWIIADSLQGDGEHTVRFNWLLPDLEWHDDGQRLRFETPAGRVALSTGGTALKQAIYRAGSALKGSIVGLNPEVCGWRSPTYAVRQPALQVISEAQVRLPARFWSVWQLGLGSGEPPHLTWIANPGRNQPSVSEIAWDGMRWELACISS